MILIGNLKVEITESVHGYGDLHVKPHPHQKKPSLLLFPSYPLFSPLLLPPIPQNKTNYCLPSFIDKPLSDF